MKRYIVPLVLLFLVVICAPMVQAQDAAKKDGKTLFMDNKCNTCHSIESQQIKMTLASSKAPDLSDVGSTQTAEWVEKFLMKQEKLHEKTHMKAWTGTPEDLKVLSTWLASLKKAK